MSQDRKTLKMWIKVDRVRISLLLLVYIALMMNTMVTEGAAIKTIVVDPEDSMTATSITEVTMAALIQNFAYIFEMY